MYRFDCSKRSQSKKKDERTKVYLLLSIIDLV